jgi:hypothetical protein
VEAQIMSLTIDTSTQWSEVVPVSASETEPWLSQAMQTLARLSRLSPNWDGANSPPIGRGVIEQMARILRPIASGPEVPPPNIGPVPGGGLQAEWQIGDKALELEVLPDNSIQVLVVNGDDMDEGSISAASPERLIELTEWLVS